MALNDDIEGYAEDGLHAPIKTGLGVFHEPGTVGAHLYPEGKSFRDIAVSDKRVPAYFHAGTLGSKNDVYMPLWLTGLEINFGTSGQEAQSAFKKDFFHQHFAQPSIILKGQCPNHYLFNKLSSFIRANQIWQIMPSMSREDISKRLLHFHLKSSPRYEGESARGRNTKGGYSAMHVSGYVKSIPAGGERFIYAPEYTIEFVIADLKSWFVDVDRIQAGSDLRHWTPNSDKLVKDPKIDPNKTIKKDKSTGDKPKAPPTDKTAPDRVDAHDPTPDTLATRLGAGLASIINDF